MLEQYLDGQGRSTGEDGVEQYAPGRPDPLRRLCDAEGFDVHIHTIGDRAVREALDAFAFAVAANGRRDARHQLAHVEFVHDDDLPRLRTLGVISNVTPLWAHHDPYITEMTRPVRVRAGRADDLPVRRHRAQRSAAGVRQRLVGVDPRPAPAAGRGGQPDAPGGDPSRSTRPRRST